MGKDGYPAIVFNVICDHEGRAQAVLSGSYRSFTEKAISRFDDEVKKVCCNTFYTNEV
jgi:hypothetical protein